MLLGLAVAHDLVYDNESIGDRSVTHFNLESSEAEYAVGRHAAAETVGRAIRCHAWTFATIR